MLVADADVAAPNLHLLLRARREQHVARELAGGLAVERDESACNACGECLAVCRFEAFALVAGSAGTVARVDPFACEGC